MELTNFKQLDFKQYSADELYTTTQQFPNNGIHWHKDHNQICLNTIISHPDDHLYGCGSLKYDWSNKTITELDNGETRMHVPERDYQPSESEFTQFNPKFNGTVFEEIYYTLQKYYTLGRVRLMQSKPKTCLTWHNDNSKRIHLPIKTNAGCQMVIENQVQHMPAGTWWLTDTTVSHTAFNASKESRIHLVAVVLEEL